MSKADFVRSLQFESKALSPFDISQRLRQLHSCVSICQLDPELNPDEYRGYMLRYKPKQNRSPQNPELYVCVVSAKQSMAWQQLVWAKEILQILDHPEHHTGSKTALEHMMASRAVLAPNENETPLNVMADKNGFLLALGSKVPRDYRNSLRDTKALPSLETLEGILLVPKEFIERLLSEEFEAQFEQALKECDD
jgi:hypothetical protein